MGTGAVLGLWGEIRLRRGAVVATGRQAAAAVMEGPAAKGKCHRQGF